VKGGWGNVIRIIHYTNKGRVESLYAHCLDRKVKSGDYVSKGQVIGTIGTANGKYLAHLHFELRDVVGMDLGPGYSWNTMGYVNPTKYIKDNS
jgi:murein DD-endopeptidase MepM/ murein hydrolase activator NlpD